MTISDVLVGGWWHDCIKGEGPGLKGLYSSDDPMTGVTMPFRDYGSMNAYNGQLLRHTEMKLRPWSK